MILMQINAIKNEFDLIRGDNQSRARFNSFPIQTFTPDIFQDFFMIVSRASSL